MANKRKNRQWVKIRDVLEIENFKFDRDYLSIIEKDGEEIEGIIQFLVNENGKKYIRYCPLHDMDIPVGIVFINRGLDMLRKLDHEFYKDMPMIGDFEILLRKSELN